MLNITRLSLDVQNTRSSTIGSPLMCLEERQFPSCLMSTVYAVLCMSYQQVSTNRVIFTLFTCDVGTVPLAQMSAERISQTVQTEGTCLPIDEKTMPVDLTEVLSKGLQANLKDRVLELHEIRGVFHKMKVGVKQLNTHLNCPVTLYSAEH